MILGLGIDLVYIPKIGKSINSDAFRKKVFTPAEIESCDANSNAAERYAGKFAAKEAFMKAIGQGIRQEIWFTQIEVLNDPVGAPYIQLHGKAKHFFLDLKASDIHVSVSHSEGMAIAVVILERDS